MANNTVTLTLPEAWAGYLVNGDTDGLIPGELAAIQALLTERRVAGDALSYSEAGYRWNHDASQYTGGAECMEFDFLLTDAAPDSGVAVYPTGEPVDSITEAQAEALRKVAARFKMPLPVTVSPSFGALLVEVPTGMWLGVEPDGYTHS